MPWLEELSNAHELRRCIRDIVALSTLPAIWRDHDPQQIGDSVAVALLSMLNADFIHIALAANNDGSPDTRAGLTRISARSPIRPKSVENILLPETLSRLAAHPGVIACPSVDGAINLASAPIGFAGDAVLVAGSRQPDFPTEFQRLLLGIAANEAAMGVQRWQSEVDERRFIALVERSSDFIGLATLDGSPQYLNPAGLALVGLSDLDEAKRMNVLDFIAPGDRARAWDVCWPAAMRTGRWFGELAFNHFQTDEAIPLQVEWFRIDHPRTHEAMNIATVGRDLRAQKRSEAELRVFAETLEQRVVKRTAQLDKVNRTLVRESDRRKRADAHLHELRSELFHAARLSAAGHMAGALAHELNQPLTAATNSINAARRLLADGARNSRRTVAEVMDEAAEQTLRAGQIIRRLREFVVRGESEKKIESVVKMVEEASALAAMGSRTLGVNVHLQFDPKASRAFADRLQVQQVLVNLVRNAMQAMEKSKRRELEVTTRLADDKTIEIAVADSGPGLPDEVSERLFEPFVSTRHDGMGLGLSICRSILDEHGGKLWSEPNVGGGMVFRFTIKAAPQGRQDGE